MLGSCCPVARGVQRVLLRCLCGMRAVARRVARSLGLWRVVQLLLLGMVVRIVLLMVLGLSTKSMVRFGQGGAVRRHGSACRHRSRMTHRQCR